MPPPVVVIAVRRGRRAPPRRSNASPSRSSSPPSSHCPSACVAVVAVQFVVTIVKPLSIRLCCCFRRAHSLSPPSSPAKERPVGIAPSTLVTVLLSLSLSFFLSFIFVLSPSPSSFRRRLPHHHRHCLPLPPFIVPLLPPSYRCHRSPHRAVVRVVLWRRTTVVNTHHHREPFTANTVMVVFIWRRSFFSLPLTILPFCSPSLLHIVVLPRTSSSSSPNDHHRGNHLRKHCPDVRPRRICGLPPRAPSPSKAKMEPSSIVRCLSVSVAVSFFFPLPLHFSPSLSLSLSTILLSLPSIFFLSLRSVETAPGSTQN